MAPLLLARPAVLLTALSSSADGSAPIGKAGGPFDRLVRLLAAAARLRARDRVGEVVDVQQVADGCRCAAHLQSARE
eukprot:3581049-Pyramimonas_sp.AAC.1